MDEEVFYYLDDWLRRYGYGMDGYSAPVSAVSVVGNWLRRYGYGMDGYSMDWIHRGLWLAAVLLLAFLATYVWKKMLIPRIRDKVEKTEAKWDDYLFSEKVLKNFSQVIPALMIYTALPFVFGGTGVWFGILLKAAAIWLIVTGFRFVHSFISSIYEYLVECQDNPQTDKKVINFPLRGGIRC